MPIHIKLDSSKDGQKEKFLFNSQMDGKNITLLLTKNSMTLKSGHAQTLLEHFIHLTKTVCNQANIIGELNIIPNKEINFGEPNKNRPPPSIKGYRALHQPFLDKATQSAHDIALIDGEKHLTYKQLLDCSMQFAKQLHQAYPPLAKIAIKVSSSWRRVAITLACSICKIVFIFRGKIHI